MYLQSQYFLYNTHTGESTSQVNAIKKLIQRVVLKVCNLGVLQTIRNPLFVFQNKIVLKIESKKAYDIITEA